MSSLYNAAKDDRSGLVVGRLLPGADLIGGLELVCDEFDIRFATILSAYGSLDGATFKTLTVPPGEERAIMLPIEIEERVEFLGGQGLVCATEDGARDTHLHGAISQATGQVRGGHFIRERNLVYNNVDFVLAGLTSLELIRSFDEATGTVEMKVGNPDV